jgi:NitT/TauT family transport system ATP-binding protein
VTITPQLPISVAESSTTPVEDSARPAVAIDHVSKVFGTEGNALHALDNLTLDVAPGEFVCLLGASGCGKSTLLNIVAGLDRPSAGTVDTGTNRTTLMFQESALFPWLTARGNVELPLKIRKVPRAERHRKADELLDLVNLGTFGNKLPHELSGGMRQRVALARALAQEADVLLMDEPFGALDAMTRDVLHDELERLWRETGLSVIFVTHNVREAVRLGDRVILLSSRPGRIVEEYPIDIERPRRLDSTDVAERARVITDRLKEEVRRHGR